MYKTFRLFTIIIAVCLTLLYVVLEGWYSYLYLWMLGIILVNLYFHFRHSAESKRLFSLFIFSFSFYSIYMYITNFIYVKDPSSDFFMIVDSMTFWDNSNFVMNSLKDFQYRFNEMAFYTAKYRFFSFQTIGLSFYAQLIDHNNILVQKLSSTFLGALSIPYIYLIIRKFVDSVSAFKYSLFFSIFSFACIYSIVFNRDPEVYFLYTIGTYLIVYYEEKRWVLLKLIFLMLLTLGFRLEHGLFFAIFIFLYLYLVSKRKFAAKAILFISVIFISLFAVPYIVKKFNSTTDTYDAMRENAERKDMSFGAAFAQLPPGVKQVLLMADSQIAPAIPFWRGWFRGSVNRAEIKLDQPGYFTPWRFMEGVAAIAWLFVWGFIIGGFKNYFFKLPINIRCLFWLSLLLIIAATAEINIRRIYCVYPILFLVSILLYVKLEKRAKRRIISRVSLIIGGLYLLYFIVK